MKDKCVFLLCKKSLGKYCTPDDFKASSEVEEKTSWWTEGMQLDEMNVTELNYEGHSVF